MTRNYKAMIKAAFSNNVHKVLNPKNERPWKVDNHFKTMSVSQKAEAFDQLIKIYQQSSTELRNAMAKRRFKNKVERIRKEKLEKLKVAS